MPNPFAITTATNAVSLDAKRHSEVSFTATNTSGAPIRGRARLEPEAPASATWLTMEGGTERDFPTDGTEQYTVKIAVPADTPAGTYSFRLNMVGVENPDELFTQGPTVTFQVPEPEPKKPFPWWIVIVAIGTLALCCVLGIGGYLVATNLPEPTLTPSPTPTPTSSPTPTPTPPGGGSGRIAFVRGSWAGGSNTVLDADIYTMALDDPVPTRLTSNREAIGWLDWSPDGQRIAFVRQSGTDLDVFVINVDGTDPQNLTSDFDTFDAEPVWSPEGDQIAFSSNRADGTTVQIYVMSANGSDVKQLTDSSSHSNISPAWSPNGQQIAFISNRDGQAEVYIMNADGSSPTRQTHNGGNLYPQWSPDGQRIAFFHAEAGANSIWIVNSDGTNLRKLTDQGFLPRWSPDGTQILFTSGGGGDFDLYVINADGSGKRQVTDTSEHDAFAIWEP